MPPLRPLTLWRARYLSLSSPRVQCRRFTGRAFTDRGRDWKKDGINVLGIETSCDDTSVALLSVYKNDYECTEFYSNLRYHERVTADSAPYGGIHPIVALESHQRHLNSLVKRAIDHLPERQDDHISDKLKSEIKPQPDLIAVTRGPGMRSNLSVGLDLAKGLALAWDVPLVGVHHMQAHALTPRLCSVLKPEDESEEECDDECNEECEDEGEDEPGPESQGMLRPGDGDSSVWEYDDVKPHFPFLTVLASGGHTMLISSESLTNHEMLAETSDIALGDCLDKAARAILPNSELNYPLGKALEDFAFGDGKYDYEPPLKRQHEIARRATQWGWSIGPPLSDSKGGEKSSRRMIYSFAGVLSTVDRLMAGTDGAAREVEERRELAKETMRITFEHLTSRILLYLQDLDAGDRKQISTIAVSGGVAANGFLRHILRSTLDARGYENILLEFPPVELCTDNALMIAWAGLEMYDAGYESKLDIKALRKWSLNPTAEDGGILGADGWAKRNIEVESEEPEKEEAYRNSNGRLAAAIVITLFLVGGVPLMADFVGHGPEAEHKPNFQSVRLHNRSHDTGYTRTAVGRMDEPTDPGD